MPGSIVTTLPGSRTSSDSWARRGASWISTPTPCPSPWPNASPNPASLMIARAIAAADWGNLVGVLDGTQGLDLPRRRHEVEPASTQCLDLHVGQDVGFEAEPSVEPFRQVDQKSPLRLLRLDAVDFPRRLDVAEIG